MSTILVIEDEAPLREEILDWLKFEGYEGIGAENGEVGIQYANDNPPDLILCDITMPHVDGYGVLVEVRANQTTAAIPFIFMTARAGHEDVRQGMTAGADDYITKPFTLDELLRTIHSRLEKRTLQEQEHQSKVEQLQKALEQEHELGLVKAKMVAMYSHDFRNPLATILSSSSLLREYWDRLDETRRKARLDQIDHSVRLLEQMLDDMLLMAQLENDSLQLKPETLDLTRFVQNVIEDFQQQMRTTHAFKFESDIHGTIAVDSRLLRQIVANLISNAVKYSPKESDVRVTLKDSGDYFVLSVQDYGIGISEDDQNRLFNPFQRGTNVGKIAGTGLGLAIVKQAVEKLGGSIQIDSQVQRGTTIRLTFPAKPPS